jgi:ATP synthase protein I
MALALLALLVSGWHAAGSAMAGGGVIMLGYISSAMVAGLGARGSAESFLLWVMLAEITKLLVVCLALLLVWAWFRDVDWRWKITGCIVAVASYGLTLFINSTEKNHVRTR